MINGLEGQALIFFGILFGLLFIVWGITWIVKVGKNWHKHL